MSQIEAYKIIAAQDLTDLQLCVTAAIAEGWIPHGSPFSFEDHSLLQAMVREAPVSAFSTLEQAYRASAFADMEAHARQPGARAARPDTGPFPLKPPSWGMGAEEAPPDTD